MKEIDFLGKKIGDKHPVFIIAEIGLNHNGDIRIAKKLMKEAKDAGCDAVKFQKRDVETLATKEFLDAPDLRFPKFGKTYRALREHLEFNEKEYHELISYAKKLNIPFFCTPFDIPSAKFLERMGVKAWKIASHCVTNHPLLEYVAKTGSPVIMSTGMTTPDEIERAVRIFKKHKTPLILLHCVSIYPTPPEHNNLRLIDLYEQKYNVPVGYSGHETLDVGYLPTLAAVARGARVIERHITLDNDMIGLDHKVSVNPENLKKMVREIRLVETMLGTGKKKLLPGELVKRNQQIVSLVSAKMIPKGTKITASMITHKGPGTGLRVYESGKVIGKTAKNNIPADTLINLKMLK